MSGPASSERGVPLSEWCDVTPRAVTAVGVARDFRTLTAQVRAAGLLNRRPHYYLAKVVVTVTAFAAGWVCFFVVGARWANLGIAAYLGVMSTQLGFLGHDAGHGQIFESKRANRRLGLAIGNGLIGMSFGWWVPKHNAHHAHPNQVNRDPDIGVSVDARTAGDAGRVPLLARCLSQRQAELFVPLMLLRSIGLYVSGVRDMLRRRDRAAVGEFLPLAGHVVIYLAVVLWVLPLPEAVAFIVVHQAVFSLYLGCSFAPNHKGMPIIDDDSNLSFAERQVMTARNITGGICANFVFGGLNYQIEHHLFPTMPRPNLARARDLVRRFCLERGLGYCEMSPLRSYHQALSGLRMGQSGALPA
jgi:fatty acid desaturase